MQCFHDLAADRAQTTGGLIGGGRIVSVSVVSHGHGSALLELLDCLKHSAPHIERVWLTHNTIDEKSFDEIAGRPWPFDVRQIVNRIPRGFGDNHNQAFGEECREREAGQWWWWWVLNPDVRWSGDLIGRLLGDGNDVFGSDIGVVYPAQVDARGAAQDYERELPTPFNLARRHLFKDREKSGSNRAVAWVNAACMLVRSDVYRCMEGFDSRYRLYVEDVDFCIRLQLAGFRMCRRGDIYVRHDAARASRKPGRAMLWHLRGLLRLWFSSPFWMYRKRLIHKHE